MYRLQIQQLSNERDYEIGRFRSRKTQIIREIANKLKSMTFVIKKCLVSLEDYPK